MNTIIGDLMEQCGIREERTDEVPESINGPASNANFVKDDLAPLVNTLIAADTVPADTLKDEIPTTSVNHTMSSDIEATVVPTDATDPTDGIQQHPGEAFLDALPGSSAASTVALPNDIKVHNDDIQQEPDQVSRVVVPNGREVHDDEMQIGHTDKVSIPNGDIVKASEPVEKRITSYVQVIATTILQSPQQRLLLRELYESIAKNWDKFSLNKKTWKSSVRHALSTNTFFIHNGRGPNGHANYWSVHEACVSMFKKGDFRSPEAKRRVQWMKREEKMMQHQEKKVNSTLAASKNINSKSGGTKWVEMQQHQFSYGNETADMTEPTDFSSSLVPCNVQINQQQYVQHHNYQQQQARHQHLPQQQKPPKAQQLPLTQQMPQTQQSPQYQQASQSQQPPQYLHPPQFQQSPQYQQHQSQQQLLHQQQYQHPHQYHYQQQQHYQHQQHQEHQPQHQVQHMEHSDCLFGNSQNHEFHQPYTCMRSQPEDMTSYSTTGYYPFNNLRSAMDYNSPNSPAPSQCTPNTAYYNNNTQQKQYFQ